MFWEYCAPRLRSMICDAQTYSKHPSFIGTEQFLIAVAIRKDADLSKLFAKYEITAEKIKKTLVDDQEIQECVNPMPKLGAPPLFTLKAKAVLHGALDTAKQAKCTYIDIPHILFAVIAEVHCQAYKILAKMLGEKIFSFIIDICALVNSLPKKWPADLKK